MIQFVINLLIAVEWFVDMMFVLSDERTEEGEVCRSKAIGPWLAELTNNV